MRIMKNIQNFLLDQDYYIDIFKDCLHVYSYEELLSLSATTITLKLKEFQIDVLGQDLVVISMDKQEILIQGKIEDIKFSR